LASAGYDGRCIIWKEENANWTKIKQHTMTASVNSVAWAPHELGAMLGLGSSDGKCTILTFRDDGSWETAMLDAHAMGCNAVSWASATVPGSLTAPTATTGLVRRLATGGCDNAVKVWSFNDGAWTLEAQLEGHTDWVRDVAFAPNLGLERTLLATCGQDGQVFVWSLNAEGWKKQSLKEGGFGKPVWRVSWSLSGSVLAVSSGDQHVSLWKESAKGEWECLSDELMTG